MSRRIMLIDPPFQKFMNFSKGGIPLGLLHLAGELKKRGAEVSVLDADYNPKGEPYPFVSKIEHYNEYLNNLNNLDHPVWKDIREKIHSFKPEIVGLSIISTKLRSAGIVADIARQGGARKIIAGGPHVSLFPQEVLEYKNIDGVVIGEGEKIFDGAINQRITKAERIKDLDELALPARETIIGVENYDPTDLGFLLSSRGCPGSCNFCCSKQLWGRSVRKRSIEKVLAEMDHINKEYGTEKFYLVDDTFTLGRRRVESFCEGVKERGYGWSCLTRVDKMEKRMLDTMVDSGCYMIKVGIESGSQRVLDLMNKGITTSQINSSSKMLNKVGVPWLAYIMVGVPGETSEDVDKTIDLIREIKPSYVSAAIYTPYPKTGFSQKEEKLDFAREEANHHSLNVLAGEVPKEKIIQFMKFADEYNHNSKKAKEIYNC